MQSFIKEKMTHNLPELKKFSVVILVAGRSLRMGSPKPFLKWDKSLTFIEKIYLEYLHFGCRQIVIVTNKNIHDSIAVNGLFRNNHTTIIINDQLEKERLFSLQQGLSVYPDSEYCFVQNVDNPFVNTILLQQLLDNKTPDLITVPCYNNRNGHPILFCKKIISQIIKLNTYNTTLKRIIDTLGVNSITVEDSNVLQNINTPEEYFSLFNLVSVRL